MGLFIPQAVKISPEYWRLVRGEKVSGKIIEWENPLGLSNILKEVQRGRVIGQGCFDRLGEFDVLYWITEKVKND